jgi:hypothetical protein
VGVVAQRTFTRPMPGRRLRTHLDLAASLPGQKSGEGRIRFPSLRQCTQPNFSPAKYAPNSQHSRRFLAEAVDC